MIKVIAKSVPFMVFKTFFSIDTSVGHNADHAHRLHDQGPSSQLIDAPAVEPVSSYTAVLQADLPSYSEPQELYSVVRTNYLDSLFSLSQNPT